MILVYDSRILVFQGLHQDLFITQLMTGIRVAPIRQHAVLRMKNNLSCAPRLTSMGCFRGGLWIAIFFAVTFPAVTNATPRVLILEPTNEFIQARNLLFVPG